MLDILMLLAVIKYALLIIINVVRKLTLPINFNIRVSDACAWVSPVKMTRYDIARWSMYLMLCYVFFAARFLMCQGYI